jgi:hypothetical protein
MGHGRAVFRRDLQRGESLVGGCFGDSGGSDPWRGTGYQPAVDGDLGQRSDG